MDSSSKQAKVDFDLTSNFRALDLINARNGLNCVCVAMNHNGRARIFLACTFAKDNRLNSNTRQDNLKELATNIKVGFNIRGRSIRVLTKDSSIIRAAMASIMKDAIAASGPLTTFCWVIDRFERLNTDKTAFYLTNFGRQGRRFNDNLTNINVILAIGPDLNNDLRFNQDLIVNGNAIRRDFSTYTRLLINRDRARAVLTRILRREIYPDQALALFINNMKD